MGYLDIARKLTEELKKKGSPPKDGQQVEPEVIDLGESTTTIVSPILPGWTVAYRGSDGRIKGGTVKEASFKGDQWSFTLTEGGALRDNQILSVAEIKDGEWMGSWTVRDWGLDGNRRIWPKGRQK